MARPDNPLPTQLDRDLAELKLLEIAQHYREVLDDAAQRQFDARWPFHKFLSSCESENAGRAGVGRGIVRTAADGGQTTPDRGVVVGVFG